MVPPPRSVRRPDRLAATAGPTAGSVGRPLVLLALVVLTPAVLWWARGGERAPSAGLGPTVVEGPPADDPPAPTLEGQDAPERTEEVAGARQNLPAPERESPPPPSSMLPLFEDFDVLVLGDVLDSRGRPVVDHRAWFGGTSYWARSSRLSLGVSADQAGADSVLTVRTDLEVAHVEGLGERILAGDRKIDLGEVRLAPPVGNVWTGRVVWSDGRPVAGARVGLGLTEEEQRAWDEQVRMGAYLSPVRYRSCTDEGEFALVHEQDVPRVILFHDPVSLLAGRSPLLGPGGPDELLVLPADQARLDHDGHVVDDRGNPVADTPVVLWPEQPVSDHDIVHTSTSPEGRLVLKDRAATTHIVVQGTETTFARTLTVAEARQLEWIEVESGTQVALSSDRTEVLPVAVEALDGSGRRLRLLRSPIHGAHLFVSSRMENPPRILVPRGTRTLVVHRDVPQLSAASEISRHPFPAEPDAVEWIRIPADG